MNSEIRNSTRRRYRRWEFLATLFTALGITQVQAQTAAYDIRFQDKKTEVKYGVAAKLELALQNSSGAKIPADWTVVQGTLPKGLALSKGADSIALEGTPLFLDKWCFVLRADAPAVQTSREKSLCVTGEDNRALKLPEIKTARILKDAYADEAMEMEIRAESSNTLTAALVDTNPAFVLAATSRSNRFKLTAAQLPVGTYTPVIQFTDAKLSLIVYKQFFLSVLNTPVNDDYGNDYQCSEGYEYSQSRGYCVPIDQDISCRSDEYYDPVLDSCVPYAPAPPTRSCFLDEYYDSYLDQCIPNSYPRCPSGSSYDHSSRRCEADFSYGRNCGYGSHWSYSQARCVSHWERSCGNGEWYSPVAGRCVDRDAWNRHRDEDRQRRRNDDDQHRRERERERSCSRGEILRGGRCVPVEENRCKPGDVSRNGSCVTPRPREDNDRRSRDERNRREREETERRGREENTRRERERQENERRNREREEHEENERRGREENTRRERERREREETERRGREENERRGREENARRERERQERDENERRGREENARRERERQEREESERRGREENTRRERERQENERRQRENEENSRRERDRQENDRRGREENERRNREREDNDRRNREREDNDRRNRDREENDRRQREENNRREREREDNNRREREDRDRRDREDRDRRDREDRDRRDREEHERRGRGR